MAARAALQRNSFTVRHHAPAKTPSTNTSCSATLVSGDELSHTPTVQRSLRLGSVAPTDTQSDLEQYRQRPATSSTHLPTSSVALDGESSRQRRSRLSRTSTVIDLRHLDDGKPPMPDSEPLNATAPVIDLRYSDDKKPSKTESKKADAAAVVIDL